MRKSKKYHYTNKGFHPKNCFAPRVYLMLIVTISPCWTAMLSLLPSETVTTMSTRSQEPNSHKSSGSTSNFIATELYRIKADPATYFNKTAPATYFICCSEAVNGNVLVTVLNYMVVLLNRVKGTCKERSTVYPELTTKEEKEISAQRHTDNSGAYDALPRWS